MDNSQAPLISGAHRDEEEEELEYDVDEAQYVADADKAADSGPSTFVLALTFAAGISGLLFGCRLALCPMRGSVPSPLLSGDC